MDRFGFQHGWPGAPGIGLRLPLSSCGCNEFPAQPCPPFPFPFCGPNGCPILLDSACVIYHKNMNTTSGLINLNLGNGSTAELIFNTIDSALGAPASQWTLPFLRSIPYTINNFQQFGQAVDNELGLLNAAVLVAVTPNSSTDTSTIHFILSGTLNRNISGSVKISATANNLLTAQPDGLYSAPQTLSINYTTKVLSISQGNSVDLTSLVCGVGGFLGNVTSDPTAVDGQYWFRTDLSAAVGLRIQLNGAVRTITTS